MLLQVHPALIPPKPEERYVPRIFGFRLHATAPQNIGRRGRVHEGERDAFGEERREGEVMAAVQAQQGRIGNWATHGAVPGSWGADPNSP